MRILRRKKFMLIIVGILIMLCCFSLKNKSDELKRQADERKSNESIEAIADIVENISDAYEMYKEDKKK